MKRRFPGLALALALPALLAGVPASADPAPTCTIGSADFRFQDEDSLRTRFRMNGDLTATPSLATVDPLSAPLRLSVGGVDLVDLPGAGLPPRSRPARRGWRIEVADAFGGEGRVTFRMDPATGLFSVSARGFDPGPLFGSGAAAVPVTLVAGEETWTTTVDFDTARAKRWTHRHVLTPRPPPPGGGGPPPPPSAGNFQTLAQGSTSGIRTPRFEAVYDDASWQALWLLHTGSGPAPFVDFSAEMVIGVWLGDRPTSGYRAEVLSLVVAQIIGAPGVGPGYLVTLRESQPGYNCVVSQVVTQPFHVVRTARTTGGVMAEMVTVADGCY